jgi:hypothetical protein
MSDVVALSLFYLSALSMSIALILLNSALIEKAWLTRTSVSRYLLMGTGVGGMTLSGGVFELGLGGLLGLLLTGV